MTVRCSIESLERRAYLATYSGVVFNDANANGVRDVGEAGVPNITVIHDWASKHDPNTGASSEVLTDANGAWTYTPASATFETNVMSFGVRLSPAWAQTAPTGHGFHDLPLADRANVNFGIRSVGGTATGRVYLDNNGNGTWDAGEKSGYNWVHLQVSGVGHPAVGLDGSFQFTAAAGQYQLQFFGGPYEWKGTAPTVTIVAGKTQSFGDFGLKRAQTTVQGRVTFSGSGEAVGGAVVFVDVDGDHVRDAGEPMATTLATGEYRIEMPWEQATRTVRVEMQPGWTGAAGGIARTLTINAGFKNWADLAVYVKQDQFRRLPMDFDGDLIPDVVRRDPQTGAYEIWQMGVGTYRASSVQPVPPADGWALGAVAEFDADKRPDFVWHNDATGETRIELRPTTGPAFVDLPTVNDKQWRLRASGDFDGDGQFDLLWRHAVTGQATAWRMDGTTHLGYQPMPWVKRLDWQIMTAADLDGDGDADVLWQNANQERFTHMFLQGSTVARYRGGMLPLGAHRFVGLVQADGHGAFDLLWEHETTGEVRAWVMNQDYAAAYYPPYVRDPATL